MPASPSPVGLLQLRLLPKPGSESHPRNPKTGCIQNRESRTSRARSAGSRFACPWFGSKISGSPAKSERARDCASPLLTLRPVKPGAAPIDGSRQNRTRLLRGSLGSWAATFAAVWREREPHPRTAHPAAKQHQPSGQNTNSYHGCSQPTAIYVHSFLRCSQNQFSSIVFAQLIVISHVFRQIVFAQISGEIIETAHKSTEPRAGEPDRGLLVTGTGGKN